MAKININISGGIQISQPNLPFRAGERISTLEDIYKIPNPFVGEIVYVSETDGYYVVTALKDKVVSGFTFPQSVVSEYKDIGDGTGVVKTITYSGTTVTAGEDNKGEVDLGSPAGNLIYDTLYQDRLSTQTPQPNVEAAFEEIYEKYKDGLDSSEIPDGCTRKYPLKHTTSLANTPIYMEELYTEGAGWASVGGRFRIPEEMLGDIEKLPVYINSSTGIAYQCTNFQADETLDPIYEYQTTDYIPVTQGEFIYYKSDHVNSGQVLVAFYDRDKNFLISATPKDDMDLSQAVDVVIDYRTVYPLMNDHGHAETADIDADQVGYIRVSWVEHTSATSGTISHEFGILRTNGASGNYEKYKITGDILRELESDVTGPLEVAVWEKNSLNPEATKKTEATTVIDKKAPFLVEIGRLGGISSPRSMKIIGELQKNNWFRYSDGSYAPTWITSSPSKDWETTDNGYDIVVGWRDPVYYIGGELGESGERVYGFFSGPTTYSGIYTKTLEAGGISGGPALSGSSIYMRSAFFDTTTSPGYSGNSGISVYSQSGTLLNQYTSPGEGGTYFWLSGYDRIDTRTTQGDRYYDADPSNTNISSVPLMSTWMAHIYAAYVKYGTKNLGSLFGYGNSGPIPTESTWGTVSGTRYRMTESAAWTYTGFTFPDDYYYYPSASGSLTKVTAVSQIFTGSVHFKLLGNEPQMALSWAVENNIPSGQTFLFQGYTFWYEDISGFPTLLEGPAMSAKLFKKYDVENYKLLDQTGAEVNFETIEVILEFPVIDGELLGCSPAPKIVDGLDVIVDMAGIPDALQRDVVTNKATAWMCWSLGDVGKYYGRTLDSNGKYACENADGYTKVGDFIFGVSAPSKSCVPYTFYQEEPGISKMLSECTMFSAYCPQGNSEYAWGSSSAEIGKRKFAYPIIGGGVPGDNVFMKVDLTHSESAKVPVCSFFEVQFNGTDE
jgi:hypothetical protein